MVIKMYNDLFSIGPISVHSYGVMIAIGFIAALLVGDYRAKKKGLDDDLVWSIFICSIVGGIGGAKLLYYIIDIKNIINNPSILLNVQNGFVVYGGIIGGVLLSWFYVHRKKTPFIPYLDLLIPSVSIGQGFGRIGCFLAGCCYGRKTDSIFGIVFHNSDFAPNGVKLIPTQLISATGDFAIAAVLIFMSRKKKFEGQIAQNYLILYGIGRFAIEMLRNDPRGAVGSLSSSQIISIFIFATGVIWKLISYKKREHTD